MRVMRLVIEHGYGFLAIGNARVEIFDLQCLRRWFRPKNRRQLFRLVGRVSLPLMELLNVCEVKRTEGTCPLSFAAPVALEVPVNAQLIWNNRICVKDSTTFKVGSQSLKHDDIWSDE